MDIDQLLKSKSPKEKMDFLNSMRCEEFDEAVRIIKKYYKTNFRV